VTWRDRLRLPMMGLMAVMVLAAAGPAGAADGPRLDIQLMVSRISDGAGGIDPRAARLHQKLKGQFRYDALKVLTTKSLNLGIDDVGTETLPNGQKVVIRPLQADAKGALLAVDVQGAVRGDYKVQNGHMLVFGAGPDGDGKLVISIEPRW
jgi:hypothetical protein